MRVRVIAASPVIPQKNKNVAGLLYRRFHYAMQMIKYIHWKWKNNYQL